MQGFRPHHGQIEDRCAPGALGHLGHRPAYLPRPPDESDDGNLLLSRHAQSSAPAPGVHLTNDNRPTPNRGRPDQAVRLAHSRFSQSGPFLPRGISAVRRTQRFTDEPYDEAYPPGPDNTSPSGIRPCLRRRQLLAVRRLACHAHPARECHGPPGHGPSQEVRHLEGVRCAAETPGALPQRTGKGHGTASPRAWRSRSPTTARHCHPAIAPPPLAPRHATDTRRRQTATARGVTEACGRCDISCMALRLLPRGAR